MSSFAYIGELVAFATTLSWSIGIFPFTEAARRMGPNPVNHIRLVFALLLLTLLAVLFVPVSFTGLFTTPLPQHWLWFGLSGVIGLALGDYFGFTSFAVLGPRTGSIFYHTRAHSRLVCRLLYRRRAHQLHRHHWHPDHDRRRDLAYDEPQRQSPYERP